MTVRPTPAGPGGAGVEAAVIEPEGTAARRAESPAPRPGPAAVGPQLLRFGLNVVAPIGVYYALHSTGVDNVVALSVAAIPPGLGAAVRIVRERKVDRLAVMVVASMLAAIAVSFITGSPRFLLAKDGWIMGLWGAWFLFSVRAERPAAFLFTRPILEGRKAFTVESWDRQWEQVPAFRRIWRTSTIMWGLGLLVDAVVRVTMAYTLPVAVVPGLGGALYPVTFVALQVVTNIYYHHAGLWTVLGARWDRSSSAFRLDLPSPPAGRSPPVGRTLSSPLKESVSMSTTATTRLPRRDPTPMSATTGPTWRPRALAVIAATVAALAVWAVTGRLLT